MMAFFDVPLIAKAFWMANVAFSRSPFTVSDLLCEQGGESGDIAGYPSLWQVGGDMQ
jgi:hypothetical protein